MKTLFVILFKTQVNGHVYKCLSNYYFKTAKAAREYARLYVENDCTYTHFEINDIMPK